MDGRLTRNICDEAGDYVVPNVLGPRDLVSRLDNMDQTVLSSSSRPNASEILFSHAFHRTFFNKKENVCN